jgi:uncharacterized RDD family membrane protein YckC
LSFIHSESLVFQSIAPLAFWVLSAFFYWSLSTHFWGGSPGKLALGLKVINADDGQTVSLGRLFLRETVGRLLSTLPLFLGYIWVSWDKERKTFHDMLAKTRVIDFKN